jgi:hypothetical protein
LHSHGTILESSPEGWCHSLVSMICAMLICSMSELTNLAASIFFSFHILQCEQKRVPRQWQLTLPRTWSRLFGSIPSSKGSTGKAGEETGGWNFHQRQQIFLGAVLLLYGYLLLHTQLPLKVYQHTALLYIVHVVISLQTSSNL